MSTTLADSRTDQLEQLDFAPSCCCEAAHLCGTHAPGEECGEPAVLIVAVHSVNNCNGDNSLVHLNVDGDEVGPMCLACFERVTAYTAGWLHRLRAAARRVGGYPACGTCGAPILKVSDVIHSAEPIL